MDKAWQIFSTQEGVFLIRIILAHIIADFALQTVKMVNGKSWFSGWMGAHISIVISVTFLFTWSWIIAFLVGLFHWLTDSLKVQFHKTGTKKLRFVTDQLLHLLVILTIWAFFSGLTERIFQPIVLLFSDYRASLFLLAYAIVIWPMGYLIGYVLKPLNPQTTSANDKNGQLIGVFERIIILTLVLLNQYEAIGFLITGKSIIRFPSQNETQTSEYVILGTLMSFAFAILTGLGVQQLLKIAIL